MKEFLPNVLALIMLLGAAGHVFFPEVYHGAIPSMIPTAFANVASTIVELAIAIGLWTPKYRSKAGLAFMMLMIAFLPIHIWDLVREDPMLGSRLASGIRLIFQLVLIYAGWRVYRND